MYRMDVPVPPQSGLLLEGVTVRLCHKKMMSDDHPASGLEDFPGVDKWEAMASPMDVNWSIH